MTNVHPFPKHPVPKKARPNPPAAAGSEFIVQGPNGASADVLLMIIHAGSMYLTTPDEQPDDDLPTAQLMRTLAGLDALTGAANILVIYARSYPEGFDQDATDQLVRQGNQVNKFVRKLYDMLPTDDFIVSMDSCGPDLMVEYATYAAIGVTVSFALSVMDYFTRRSSRRAKTHAKPCSRNFRRPIWKRGKNVFPAQKVIPF